MLNMSSFNTPEKLEPSGRTRLNGGEIEYRPHIRHMEPNLTECDLDWSSRLRWLPEPRYSDASFPHIKMMKFPEETRLLRSFPRQPKTFHAGKRCLPEGGLHTRTMWGSTERTLESTIGRKKHVQFNCHSAPGSRPYLTPEYSPDFHKIGSTFMNTQSQAFSADTFMPLQPPPNKTCIPYVERKMIEDRQAEILEVKKLSEWKPAPVIFKTVLDN